MGWLKELHACCPLEDAPLLEQPWFHDDATKAEIAARCNEAGKRAADAMRLKLEQARGIA